MWKSNPKAWLQPVFQDWFSHCVPEAETCCVEKDVPFNIQSLSAPGHPLLVDDFHPNVEVVHVTHPTYGPSRVLLTFRKYYLCHTFHQEVKALTNQEQPVTVWEGLHHLQGRKKH